jgi:hypothetical protein
VRGCWIHASPFFSLCRFVIPIWISDGVHAVGKKDDGSSVVPPGWVMDGCYACQEHLLFDNSLFQDLVNIRAMILIFSMFLVVLTRRCSLSLGGVVCLV